MKKEEDVKVEEKGIISQCYDSFSSVGSSSVVSEESSLLSFVIYYHPLQQ